MGREELVEFYYGNGTPGGWVLHATNRIKFPENRYRVGVAITSHTNDWRSETTFNYDIARDCRSSGSVTGDTEHDATKWTKVAGREELKDGEPFGPLAFNSAFEMSDKK